MPTGILFIFCLIGACQTDSEFWVVFAWAIYTIPLDCLIFWCIYDSKRGKKKAKQVRQQLSALNEKNRLSYLELQKIKQFSKIRIGTDVYFTADIKKVNFIQGVGITSISFSNFTIPIDFETQIEYL